MDVRGVETKLPMAPAEAAPTSEPSRPAGEAEPAARPASPSDASTAAVRGGPPAVSAEGGPGEAGPSPTVEHALAQMLRQTRVKLRFDVDERTEKVVVRVVDPETDEVIRQIPPEEMLRLAARLSSVRGLFLNSKV